MIHIKKLYAKRGFWKFLAGWVVVTVVSVLVGFGSYGLAWTLFQYDLGEFSLGLSATLFLHYPIVICFRIVFFDD